ncbi:protein of unknown function [Methylorubrum extorquens]|uniref:Uncharacterized protein n=1 Tax=Methylorubrum extorquens TaxID=408 RepID=A0A2N9AMR2_METEX|nr:protein of unknown function [Methylorubrum extorquens]
MGKTSLRGDHARYSKSHLRADRCELDFNHTFAKRSKGTLLDKGCFCIGHESGAAFRCIYT